MRKLYSEIKGTDICAIEDNFLLGIVKDVVIDFDNGEVKAFLASAGLLSKRILQPRDILKWTEKIYIEDIENLSHPEEIIRLRNIYDEFISLHGLSVFTESDINLGQVIDYRIFTDSYKLMEIHVGKIGWFGRVRGDYLCVKKKDIIKISENGVIVADMTIDIGEEEDNLEYTTAELTY